MSQDVGLGMAKHFQRLCCEPASSDFLNPISRVHKIKERFLFWIFPCLLKDFLPFLRVLAFFRI